MYSLLLLINLSIAWANYLEAESNFLKPKLERNNIVNKGVWVKNKLKDSLFEKTSIGDFIFRPNSADVDNILQNNFDAFGANFLQDVPFLPNYVERTKRGADHIRKRHPRKSMKKCKNKKDCKYNKINFKQSSTTDSNFISDLKPASVFNDYPYEVAILLNNNIIKINKDTNATKENELEINNTITGDDNNIKTKVTKVDFNVTKYEVNNSKRDIKGHYESVDVKDFVLLDSNKTSIIENEKERSVFGKDEKIWHQNAPVAGIDMYKVIPKEHNNKPINERGLIKVISMLTKTFKKIMKQHEEIKTIHDQLVGINDDFLKNIASVTDKFKDFDDKYSYLIKCNEDLKRMEENLIRREEHFKSKQTEMTNNLIEFENQQKKFLLQQKQFYSIQKLMLDQNEKINVKQNTIAKTQSEISHRQNNFARILKKAKQIYIDNKLTGSSKIVLNNINNNTYKEVTQTTPNPEASESIKINLFQVPTTNIIKNQDELIIKEKDEQAIDDLVYKFYFNNTFIDNVMKNKLFNTYTPIESKEVNNNMKHKRNDVTFLIPVNKTSVTSLKRNKRWISRSFKRNNKRKSHSKGIKEVKKDSDAKDNPFLAMATNFCNQIGQNGNPQILGWCVEKALRRLRYMDSNMFGVSSVNKETGTTSRKPAKVEIMNKTATESTTAVPTTLQVVVIKPEVTPVAKLEDLQNVMFFPDNDELESNLKAYDLKPDTEGNVYYEGSIHASEMAGPDTESISDLMPGLDSNSRVDVDPLAFDLHARRRAFVERLNANILKRMSVR